MLDGEHTVCHHVAPRLPTFASLGVLFRRLAKDPKVALGRTRANMAYTSAVPAGHRYFRTIGVRVPGPAARSFYTYNAVNRSK